MNYINQKYYKSDITTKIIECAYRVHNFLGNGFQEIIYQRALWEEFVAAELDFEREKEMPIIYNGKNIGARRTDFLVDGDVMVELKALNKLEDTHFAQILNYLEAYKVKTGLLINFGAKQLEIKRFVKWSIKQFSGFQCSVKFMCYQCVQWFRQSGKSRFRQLICVEGGRRGGFFLLPLKKICNRFRKMLN